MNDELNLGVLSDTQFKALEAFDKTMIGTPKYIGVAYFWSYSYRYYLRDASPSKRREIHQKLLDAELDVSQESKKHDSIIESLSKNKT